MNFEAIDWVIDSDHEERQLEEAILGVAVVRVAVVLVIDDEQILGGTATLPINICSTRL